MALGLRLDYEVLTPLFLGGADVTVAELRPPTFKGLLRFWYRAVAPDYAEWEAKLFGGIAKETGQSGVLLRIDGKAPRKRLCWPDLKADRFSTGSRRRTQNGLTYLGFPFQMKKDRQAIPPGHTFSLRCLLPCPGGSGSEYSERLRRAVAGACWLLAHCGGAGSRSRRGFGSLALRGWAPEAGDWPELDALPLLARAASVQEADAALTQGLNTLRSWFSDQDTPKDRPLEHPHFGSASRRILLDDGVPKSDWDKGLAAMGLTLQKFRQRGAPDYQSVKDHVEGTRSLKFAPSRTSFGLPLTFRYSSVKNGRPVTFVPYNEAERSGFERHGSLLFLRLTAVGENLHPFYLRLDGPVPGQSPPAAIRGQARRLLPAQGNAMDAFLDSLSVFRGRGDGRV